MPSRLLVAFGFGLAVALVSFCVLFAFASTIGACDSKQENERVGSQALKFSAGIGAITTALWMLAH